MTREKTPQFCIIFRLLYPLLFFCLRAQKAGGESKSIIPFDVGVVLETETWIGSISWSCMRMAVDDFYAVNPGYSTRISLHLRDSGDQALGSAVAAIDLIKNVQAKAIIGPQTSTNAQFVIDLGEKTQVPIISSSAKSPSLLTTQSSYFIRTAFNDNIQANVVASIVQQFNWRQVVPVYVDDEYGNGILPCLINTFQEIDVRVPYRSRIPPSATMDEILRELNKLKEMQTRVFVVHMTFHLGLHLFTAAEQAGMLKEGYVWITTYGLTDIVDLMGSPAATVMRGVLGLKPFVNRTSKLRDFNQRWREMFDRENPHAIITEPTVFGLWAYDTVWALALAAEKVKAGNFTFPATDDRNGTTEIESLGSSSIGPEFVKFIQSTKFDGLAGKFELIDSQLESEDFEIVNVVGNGMRRVGFWSPPHNISGRRHSADKIDGIVWPGGDEVVPPKGWEWPTAGKRLKIGVPVKPGFPEFIRIEEDPVTKVGVPKGYCIDVFLTVMKDLPYAPYDFELFEGTYDDLVYQVYLKNYDAVVGDVTIVANRSMYVDFTFPYTESGVSMLVPVKDNRKKGPWAFLDPLTTDLWVASGVFFIFTGFVIWLLEHRINNDFRGAPSEQLGTVLYFSFSTLVFAHREKVLSSLARIVVVVWLFVVLVLQSSYTASLTSMLTVEQLQPTVADLNDLIKNGYQVGYLSNSFIPSMLKRLNFNESKLIAYDSPAEYHDAMADGTVAAIVDEIPYLRIFLNHYCGKYAMVGPTYKTDGFGFVFPKNSPLVPAVSRAILKLLESDTMVKFENKLYGNASCPTQEENATNSNSLSFYSFWGLFLITGAASMAALILYLAHFLYKHREYLRNSDPGSSVWAKLILLFELYDQMEKKSDANATTGLKGEERVAGKTMIMRGDVMSPAAISGPQTPSSISSRGIEIIFESGEEMEDSSGDEELPGREISRQNPDPPSFADMLTARDHSDS
ncbi:Glutamate receptor 2.8 [Platanthera zijinensis]|uniref:Glutamate receptor n=1 Tax=Platanthera zijinensis TaxID=2320716 RepID=A0AAP0BCK5_9ASPA